MDKKKWDLAALATIPLMMTLANSMLLPVLPLMQKTLGISAIQTSLIITVYAGISILCIPIAGYLSDRYGRKKIILLGLTITAIGGAISGFGAWLLSSHIYLTILAGRLIQGIGAAGAFPIVLPLVGDMYKREDQVSSSLGIVETSNTFGKVLSPVLGSALSVVVWFLPLAVIPILSFISIVAVAIFVKAPKQKKNNRDLQSFLGTLKNIFFKNGLWLYAIFFIGCMVMFIMFGFLYFLSNTLEDQYHIKNIYKGLVLAIPLFAVCVSTFITGKLIGKNKHFMKWITIIGLLVLAVGMFVCGLKNNDSLILFLFLLFIGGIGIGLTLPSLDALITEGIEKEERGTITALYSSARFIGVAGGPLIVSTLMKHDHWLFYMFAAVGLGCCLLTLAAIKPNASQ
ncbi:MFS transporter, ACDE family, multidrug resistance protein [Paenibacillus algorifonticola]|uniref:MFS transporter, ACDE family, multidrug resistance protein n=1 Tax=Paenibacillus algorifonticola TaxID=684063 RepID=A0A1I2GWJ9_9BACL|nr:MFS transporter [Paenibacillus algorifonticola]SFF20996.1 MFS transporter, ACDE family, multidrug resistance protein [Paenibacillus algorifonticola]